MSPRWKRSKQDSPPPQRNTSLTPLTSCLFPFPLLSRYDTTLQRNTDGVENSDSTTRWRISVATNSFRCKEITSAVCRSFRAPLQLLRWVLYFTPITLLCCACRTFRPAPGRVLIMCGDSLACNRDHMLDVISSLFAPHIRGRKPCTTHVPLELLYRKLQQGRANSASAGRADGDVYQVCIGLRQLISFPPHRAAALP